MIFYNRPSYFEFSFESVAVFVNSGGADDWGHECGRVHVDPALSPQRYQVWCDGAVGSYVTIRMVDHNLRDARMGKDLGYLVLGEITPYVYQGLNALESSDLGLGLAADEVGSSINLLAGFLIGLLCAALLLALAWRLAVFCGVRLLGKRVVQVTGAASDNLDDGPEADADSRIVEHALTPEVVHALVRSANAKSAALVGSSDEDARVRSAMWLTAAEALAGVQEAEAAAAAIAKHDEDEAIDEAETRV